MEDQVIISRTKLEGLENDVKKYRSEMVAEKERLVKEFQRDLEEIKEGAAIFKPDDWRPWYVFSKERLVERLINDNKELAKKAEGLEANNTAITERLIKYIDLPWYKRIFTTP